MASDIAAEVQKGTSKLHYENEEQRVMYLNTARALVKRLEKPHERVMRIVYNDTALIMAIKVLVDLAIFKALATASKPCAAKKLAHDSNADPVLVERLLKHVATDGLVDESGADTYVANDLTRCIASPDAQGMILDMFQIIRVVAAMPDFFSKSNYVNPTDKDKSPWKFAYDTDQHYFEYINSPGREKNLEAFRNHMQYKDVGLKWYELPELMESLFHDANIEKDDVRLVDVGGSSGHDLLGFHKTHPSLPGRLILQDLDSSIQSTDTEALTRESIEPMGHDFFTPQPIHGAKVYYLKMCLHDWPAQQCREILTQLKPALKSGYSRILLDEIVIPDEKADWFETSLDLLMMQVHSAQERREREWKALVSEVPGLRIKEIWNLRGSATKIIEIEVFEG